MTTTHTLSVLVENKPGVLARVAGLFSRRGFNIESLAVGPTEHPEISRITIVVSVEGRRWSRSPSSSTSWSTCSRSSSSRRSRPCSASCCWSRCGPTRPTRRDVLQIVELFRAKVVDVGPEALTIELTGRPDKLEAHAARCSSRTASARWCSPAWSRSAAGPRSMTQAALRAVDRTA